MKGAPVMHLPKETDSFEYDIDNLIEGYMAGSNNVNEVALSNGYGKLMICKDCQQLGRESFLRLYQINFNEAVYLCPSPLCLYPMREANFTTTFIVNRDASLLCTSVSETFHSPDNNTTAKAAKRGKIDSFSEFFQEFDADSLQSSFQMVNGVASDNQAVGGLEPDPDLEPESDRKICTGVTDAATYSPPGHIGDSLDNSEMFESPSEDPLVELNREPAKQSFVVSDEPSSPQKRIETARPDQIGNSRQKAQHSADLLYHVSLVDNLPRPPSYQSIVHWSNSGNSCWLDSILMCLTNSVIVRAVLNNSSLDNDKQGILKKICLMYDHCQSEYTKSNGTDSATLDAIGRNLANVRNEIIHLIKQTMPIDQGGFQSLLEMFPMVLRMNESVETSFKVHLLWDFKCGDCGHRRVRRTKAHIISFPYTHTDFHPLNAYFERRCFCCKMGKGRMTMLMEELPPCLIFHFREGLRSANFRTLDFGQQGCLYSVFAVVQYIERPSKHFVTWLRDVKTGRWLCSDDLRHTVCQWQKKQPDIPPEQVHMVLWERQSVSDPRNSDKSSISTVTNHEAKCISDEIPAEVFQAHELDETIVLYEDDVLNNFHSVGENTMDRGSKDGCSHQEPSMCPMPTHDDSTLTGASTPQRNLDNGSFLDSIMVPEHASSPPFQHEIPVSQSTPGSISMYPRADGMNTIQIVAPENTCNIIIMAGKTQQSFVYSGGQDGAVRPQASGMHRTHSFLNKVPLYSKGYNHTPTSQRVGQNSSFHPYKPRRHFRLAGYSSNNTSQSHFSPLRTAKSTSGTDSVDRPYPIKHSEASDENHLNNETQNRSMQR